MLSRRERNLSSTEKHIEIYKNKGDTVLGDQQIEHLDLNTMKSMDTVRKREANKRATQLADEDDLVVVVVVVAERRDVVFSDGDE